jgi:hypothetical protein
MTLTNFGEAIAQSMRQHENPSLELTRAEKMEASLGSLNDKELVAITYFLFPDLAKKSTISAAIEPLIDALTLNGKPLRAWDADDFLEHVRDGRPLSPGRSPR